jgi:outer membrane murein-binding lipoprotein Lpp
LDNLSTQIANLTATMNEVLARITDNTSGLIDLEDKVTGLSTEVSSLKADQDRLHVAINNIQ